MNKKPGTIGWFDLTISNAEEVTDFYEAVLGWKPELVSMGDYNDYNMTIDGIPQAGVCHKKGPNEHLPSTWMIYINVENIETSAQAVVEKGGELLGEIREMKGYGKFCFIKDPAGAASALFEPEIE